MTDAAELAEFRLRKRKEFEDALRRKRADVGLWLRYAKWEESQFEIERARSVYERALDVDYKASAIWLRYAEMEMRNKFINRARNVWDRAISLLPRVETFWYKYTYMEEMLGNVNAARMVFERWMGWEPPDQAWLSYAKLEERAGEWDRCRAVWERYVACHPSQTSYVRYAKWEERQGQKALSRRVYERAAEELGETERDCGLFLAFAQFEERCGEHARSTAIYTYALQSLSKATKGYDDLHAAYLSHEKQHGERAGVENVILTKRRAAYAEAVASNPLNYDAWFDWIRLEEAEVADLLSNSSSNNDSSDGNGTSPSAAAPGGRSGSSASPLAGASPALLSAVDRTRDVYERAVANVPPVAEKRFWRRYVYLWINYALFEEATAGDLERARAVYRAALKVVPHKSFTFGKLWTLAAGADVRAKDVTSARKLLGQALGMCPKESVLRWYIDLELRLGEVDRARRLYEKLLQLWPANVAGGWLKYAQLETSVGEDERARALFGLGISQPLLDMPEALWKAFIDFEIERGENDAARDLYNRLLARTQHVKVWLSFATFEASVVGDPDATRAVYDRAYTHFKSATASAVTAYGADSPEVQSAKEARALIVETWKAFEAAMVEDELTHGGDGSINQPHLTSVSAKVPKRVVERREARLAGIGSAASGGWEEFTDYLFPDDEVKPSSLKLLELAQKWKAAGGSLAAALAAKSAAASAAEPEQLDDEGGGAEDDGRYRGLGSYQLQGDGGDGEDHEDAYPSHAGLGSGYTAAAAAAEDANALDINDDGGGGGGDHSGRGGLGLERSGRLRGEDAEGDAAPAAKRMRLPAPSFVSSSVPQNVNDESHLQAGLPGDDPHVGREVERQQEDEVRAAPSSSVAPRDLYSEEDAGADADRDM